MVFLYSAPMAPEALYVYLLHAVNVSRRSFPQIRPFVFATKLIEDRFRSGLAHMRTRIRVGFAIIAVTYIATIGSILGGCGAPFSKNWQIHPDPGSMLSILDFAKPN